MKKVLSAVAVVVLIVFAALWLGPCEDGLLPVGEEDAVSSDGLDPSVADSPSAPVRYVRADSAFAEGLQRPNFIAQLADGRVLVTEFHGGRVLAFGTDGTPAPVPFATGINGQYGIAQLSDGRVLLGTASGIDAYDSDGTYRAQFANARGYGTVPLQDGGALLVQVRQVLKIAADGTLSPQPFMTPSIQGLYGARQLSDGRVLVLNRGSGEVIDVSADGTSQATFATDRQAPMGAAQLADGRVLIAEAGGRVSMFDADGTEADSTFATGLSGLSDIVRLDDGRVLVVEKSAGRVTAFVPVP